MAAVIGEPGWAGLGSEARLESGGERWHSKEDERERRGEEGSEQMDGSGWRAAAPTECRGPVASEQLQRPAFCIGWASRVQPMASIRACLMRLDGCPYSAANSRQMPRLGDAAPSECNYGLYLAWNLGLA